MNYQKRFKLRNEFNDDETKPFLREFKIDNVFCVSVTDSTGLKGFYVGVSEDYIEGIIEDCDLIPTAKKLKESIKFNCE